MRSFVGSLFLMGHMEEIPDSGANKCVMIGWTTEMEKMLLDQWELFCQKWGNACV